MLSEKNRDIKILTVQEVAGLLRVHRSTVSRFAQTGELKSYRVGNRRLFKDEKDTGLIRLFRNKNTHERTEFLMPRTRKALLDWQAHIEWMRKRKRIEPVDNVFVFCRLNGTPIKRFDKAWRNVLKIACMDDFHYHDLRHTFCSNLILSGSDLKEVKDMIGHRDLSTTDRYSHLTAVHKKQNQERLAEHYTQ